MNSSDKIKKVSGILKSHNIEDAVREAELIVSHCLGIDRIILYRDNPGISKDILEKIDEFVARRVKREPLQYILGYTEFYGIKIKVGPGVLIPRPETELLVEEVVKILKSKKSQVTPHPLLANVGRKGFMDSSLLLLDLCTGSGCIALALAREFPDAKIYGIDKSEKAIEYAYENAQVNDIQNVMFLIGNLYEPVKDIKVNIKNHQFDLIVSNPPYIKRDEIQKLQTEIKDWEPTEALDGGEDGLDYYRMIIPDATHYLKKNGHIVLETGAGYAAEAERIAKNAGFTSVIFKKDYAGIERIIIIRGVNNGYS